MADEDPVEVPQEPLDYIAILKKSLLTGHAADHYPFGIPCVRLVDILTMKEKKLLNSKPQVDRNKVVQEINNLHKDFIRLTETVGNLVQDSRHEEVLQCLKDTMDNARPSWQMVFTCLSAVVKGSQSTPASAAAGYLLLPQLLKNSTMLFFFLQNLKLAKPNPKKAGFGRGLKTAIRRWYYQLTPEQLLLELWHRPHAYNWSHKDVMKLVHIQPEALPIGLQVIVFWFFNDLAKTKSKYAPVQDAAVYVNYIDNLVNKEHEGSLQFLRVEMLQKLEPTSQCRLVRTQDKLLRDSKGYPHLLEKLDSPSVIMASSDPSFIMTMTESSADADAYTSPPEPSEIQWSASHALVEQLQRSDLPKQVPPVNLIISANNMTRRIKNSLSPRGKQVWRGGVPLLVSPLRKQELYKTPIMAHLLEPLNLYSSLVHKAALEHSVASLFPDLYFVCEPNMQLRKFIDTMPGFNVHKQV
ncbi:RNA-binding protein Ro60-like [Hyalella azteca]|uniref:RNA-binding protein Ro60-like n=1 Tax=Hyalella azteca TaxID=294128 RepID=A0A979FRP2_HYAAZ|nr:RNA-binding protein Ro60-like [Hyalella azteca]